jgi:hypothetical protein
MMKIKSERVVRHKCAMGLWLLFYDEQCNISNENEN